MKAQEPWKGEPKDSLTVSLITTYVFLRGRNRKTNLTGFNSSKQFYLPRFFTSKGQVLELAAGKKKCMSSIQEFYDTERFPDISNIPFQLEIG